MEDFKNIENNNPNRLLKLLAIIFILLIISFIFTKKIIPIWKNKINDEKIKKEKIEEEKIKKEQENKRKEEEENAEKSLSLFAVGDALIHDTVYISARSGNTYDFRPKLRYLKEMAKKSDLAYYNQETLLAGDEIPLSNYPRFCSPTQVGDGFIDAGFNLVSLANNHTLDKGTNGVNASLRYWNKKRDKVMFHGSASSEEESNRIDIREKNGIRYTMLSYRMPELSNGLPYEFSYQVNDYTFERAKVDIEKVKDKVDLIIVAMHWGIENSDKRSDSQLKVAKELESLGVHLIIGNHSHVIQPVEKINDTFVIYSLGNIISDQIPYKNLIGAGVSMDIKLKNKKINIDNIEAQIYFTVKREGYVVKPANQVTYNDFPQKDTYFQSAENTLKSLYKDIKVSK